MKRTWVAYPYTFWMIIFTVIPLSLLLFYSFTTNGPTGISFSYANFERFFEPIYIKVLFRSLMLAGVSTILCMIIGYPTAMILADRKLNHKNTLVLLMVLPMWMNSLLRTYAWLTLLERKGLINMLLTHI